MSKTHLLVIAPPGHHALRRLAQLDAVAEISVSDDEQELERLAAAAEVILFCSLSRKPVSFPTLWRHAASVRWVHSLWTGVEKVLFPELVASAVPVTNARGIFKRALAEFAVLGILFHYKKVRRLIDSQRDHKWDGFHVKLADRRVMGVLGYGEIGRECARLAAGLGLKIHAVRRAPEKSANDPLLERAYRPEALHEMLARIDVLICAAPLTRETRHLLSDAQFEVMKPTAIVINVGRGPVIDEAALIRALQQRRIAGAALDVYEEEPLPPSSPLWDMENVLMSPHCTDQTDDPDFMDLAMQFFVENFMRYRNGEALQNVVDKEAGY
jgi:phosphoglycerate dehydrogenase-like enzyme